ncbi:MAG TPA: sugar phosphate isomerase/epimerase [Thermoproteota archaeon]|nr:sugar phosphate isomerase/epimerase [Thermoproteota archaeon]
MEPKIGAQLIIWGERQAKDLGNVLKEVASLRYAGVEMGPGPLANLEDPKKLFTSNGLVLAGLHIGVGDMKVVDTCLQLLRKCDAHYLLFSGAGGRNNSEEEYRQNSKFIKAAAEKSRELNIRVCYHNHYQEIVDGAKGIKIVCSEVEPELLSLCVDTFWVQYAGASPVQFIKENLDRISYLHLKDLKDKEFVELGQGVVDFQGVFKAIEGRKIEWAVVEQDRTKKTPKESMRISRLYLKEKLGL